MENNISTIVDIKRTKCLKIRHGLTQSKSALYPIIFFFVLTLVLSRILNCKNALIKCKTHTIFDVCDENQ